MALSSLGSTSFASLAKLNSRIMAAASDTGGETTDDGVLTFPDGTGTDRPADVTDDDKEKKLDEFQGWSRTDKFEFESIVNWIYQSLGDDLPSASSTLVDSFLEDWAVKWREDQGLTPTQDPGRAPTARDLLSNDDFMAGVSWLPFRDALAGLPAVWTSEQEVTDEESGKTEVVPVFAVNDPLTGVSFIEERIIPKIDLGVKSASTLGGAVRSAISTLVRQGPRSTSLRIQEQLAQNPTTPSYIKTLAGMRTRLERSVAHISDDDTPVAVSKQGIIPHITEQQFTERLTQNRDTSGSTGSGGGTKRTLKFDKNHLLAQVEDLWHRWMLEPGEAPASTINSIVDNYIREATAFWTGGGQLDFDTYVKTKLKEQPRYKTVYKHKLPGTSEEEFLASFTQPIKQFGQTDTFNQQQGFAAVTSGAAPTEQMKRISRTREVENAGGFSQRLAQTLKGVGVG